MKSYIITIIGATLLSALSGIIAPEKWRGYVGIITGLVVASCIVSPVVKLVHSDILADFDYSFEAAAEGKDLQAQIVVSELEKRINADIEQRMKSEFNINIKAECSIDVDDDGNIKGVEGIHIYGGTLSDRAIRRLCEVYGLSPDRIR